MKPLFQVTPYAAGRLANLHSCSGVILFVLAVASPEIVFRSAFFWAEGYFFVSCFGWGIAHVYLANEEAKQADKLWKRFREETPT